MDRVDGRAKVTGAATYSAEFVVPNVTHAFIVQSTIAKGTITEIDSADAEKSPGVLAVYTHLNAPRLPVPKHNSQSAKRPTDRRVMVLQDPVIYYNGQPVAFVVAETLEQAAAAAALVRVTYAGEDPVTDLQTEAPNAYAPSKGGGGGDAAATSRGDFKKYFAAAPVQVHEIYSTPMENHNPMETHATIAIWQDADHLLLYESTQGVHTTRKRMSGLLDMPEENIRVISFYIGGGFGTKGPVWSHTVLATMAAKQLGRPVKISLTRQQMFNNTGFRSHTIQEISLGSNSDGTLQAVSHDVLAQTSTYEEFLETSAIATRMLYSCPNVSTGHKLAMLNFGTPSFMRAPGEASGTFAIEVAMDELAHKLKLDPVELRLRNYAGTDENVGKPFSSKSLRECYRLGAEKFGWKDRAPAPASMMKDGMLTGYGMATSTYPVRRSPSSALARIMADGTLIVQAGTQDIGTGTYTIMTQIAADAMGMPPARVKFQLGDTLYPETPVSGGSQTAASTGSAVYAAGQALIAKLAEMASADASSPLHGVKKEDVIAHNEKIVLKVNPAHGQAFTEILARANQPSVEVKAQSGPGAELKKFSEHSFGAQFCEVRVDPQLGEVRVARWLGVFGAGRILNEKTARSQLMGGIVFGIGMALTEATIPDLHTGRIVNANLAEYHVPVNADVPQIDVLFVDESDTNINPIGVKGIGEIGITGASAAISNAIFHATGKRIRDLPITPDKLI